MLRQPRRILRWRRTCAAPSWCLACGPPPWKLKPIIRVGRAGVNARSGKDLELEPPTEAGCHRPVGGELHAVHVLVERELNESVGLQALRQHVAHPRAEEEKLAAAVLGLGFASAVPRLVQEVELQHEAELFANALAIAEVERGAGAGLEV